MANDRQQELKIKNANIDADITGLPYNIARSVLDDETCDPSGSNAARTDGGDFRIYRSSGQTNEMARAIHKFEHDTSTGADDALVDIWCNDSAFVVSSTADTSVFVTYGDGTLTDYAASATFGSENAFFNEEFVMLMADTDAPSVIDSTGNHTPSDVGTFSSATDDGLPFDGSTNSFSVPDAAGLDFSDALSLRAHASNVIATGLGYIIAKPIGSGWSNPWTVYNLSVRSTNVLTGWVADTGGGRTGWAIGTSNVTTGTTPHHLAYTYDKVNGQIHVDGSEEDTTAGTISVENSSQPLAIGIRSTTSTGEFFEGTLKSILMRGTFIADAQVKAESINVLTPLTFTTVGTPTAIGGAAATRQLALLGVG